MGAECCVPNVVCGVGDRACFGGRVSWWTRMAHAMDGGGNDANGAEHGGQRPVDRDRGHDNGGGRTTDRGQRQQPDAVLILSGIALGGLLLYVLIYKMDPTTAVMLSGFFGVLTGRLSKTNGHK